MSGKRSKLLRKVAKANGESYRQLKKAYKNLRRQGIIATFRKLEN